MQVGGRGGGQTAGQEGTGPCGTAVDEPHPRFYRNVVFRTPSPPGVPGRGSSTGAVADRTTYIPRLFTYQTYHETSRPERPGPRRGVHRRLVAAGGADGDGPRAHLLLQRLHGQLLWDRRRIFVLSSLLQLPVRGVLRMGQAHRKPSALALTLLRRVGFRTTPKRRTVNALSALLVFLGAAVLHLDAQTDLLPHGCCIGDCMRFCMTQKGATEGECILTCGKDCVRCVEPS